MPKTYTEIFHNPAYVHERITRAFARAGHDPFQTCPDRLFPSSPNHGKANLNLWEANAQQLRDAGVRQIEMAELCTACHKDIFFSHRGDKGRSGRFSAFIMLETW